MTNLIIVLVALAAAGPLAIIGLRLARKYRRVAFAATSLLLLFGVNFTVDPPPPQRMEAMEPAEMAGEDDDDDGEPK